MLEDITSDNKKSNELQRVHSWLKAKRLSLNVKKSKYMLFCKQKRTEIRELNLRISNGAIQSVNDFNLLCLHINSKLNWNTHTNVISKRMPRAVIKKIATCFSKNDSTYNLQCFDIASYYVLPLVMGVSQCS